ncbi:hypothetical protein CSKR_109133 [Clonorchis sinensis]|uniref:Uncharacterized protein n=1 Tax=Clonorchis sinensis TaxID=79923 RepID=A0A3R7F2M7_CLOSI|nr:hypothetical protein CSKR_109133 [Clonorchis sinensis]
MVRISKSKHRPEYIRNSLLIRLLKILRQLTTGFALLGAHQVGVVSEFPSNLCSTSTQIGLTSRNTLICNQSKSWHNRPQFISLLISYRQLNVLHQAASCFSWHDIRDIAIHVYTYKPCAVGTLVPAATVSTTGKRECGTYNQALEAKACSVCSEIG